MLRCEHKPAVLLLANGREAEQPDLTVREAVDRATLTAADPRGSGGAGDPTDCPRCVSAPHISTGTIHMVTGGA